MGNFPPVDLNALNRFANVAWGKPHALLKRLDPQVPEGVEFIDLSEYSTAFWHLFPGNFQYDKILVRNEYRAALQALQANKLYRKGTYVIGQPGIGKTYFLIYALVYFLGQKKPVALNLPNSNKFYALFRKTVTLHSNRDAATLYNCNFVWALCDSNANVEQPPTVFTSDASCVRIIHAASPKKSRWKEWSKQVGAQPYVMDIWSDDEVVQLATLLGFDIERLTTLARDWGTIPRTLLNCVQVEEVEGVGTVEKQYAAVADRAVKECADMVYRAVVFDLPDDAPSSFYFIRPLETDDGVINRGLAYVYVPTPKLRTMLAEALQGKSNLIKLEFYDTLSHRAVTRQAAGFIYESWFHSFFSSSKAEIICKWVPRDTKDARERLPTRLRGSNVLVPAARKTLRSRAPPYYWVPPTRYFRGIDSALVLEKEIFAFQVTIGAEHKTPIEGMQKLREDLPPHLKKLPWRVVFIGPEKDTIKWVARAWAGRLSFSARTKKTRIPVAWSVVDPVKAGITYTPYRDESM